MYKSTVPAGITFITHGCLILPIELSAQQRNAPKSSVVSILYDRMLVDEFKLG